MNILALDLAKQTGFALFLEDNDRMSVEPELLSCTKSFSPLPGQDVSALFGKFSIWLDKELDGKQIGHVAYELVNWKIINKDWRIMYLGMTAIIRGACFNRQITSRGYPVQDVKMAATGKAKADKPEMISSARAQWPEQTIIDDNQADALWVLYVAMVSLDMPVGKHVDMLF